MSIAILGLNQKSTATREVFAASDVRTLIANHLGVHVKRVTDEARFADDLGADWLDYLELMILIEDQFTGMEMTDADVDHIEVVGDLIRHIECANSERRRRGAAPVIRKLFGPCLARAVKPAKHQEGSEQAAFFLRLANDAMRSLTGWCPATQLAVDLQIYADYATLTRIRSNSVRFQCPHCGGEEHESNVGAACLQPPPRSNLSKRNERAVSTPRGVEQPTVA
jgi:acyl carrier protein